MNHPTPDEFLEYHDGDLAAERQAEIANHVADCAACRQQASSWAEVRSTLGAWDLPIQPWPVARTSRQGTPRLSWKGAAAAALFMAAGFGAARFSSPARDAAAVREDIVRQIRGELRNEIQAKLAVIASEHSSRQEELGTALAERIDEFELQWQADFLALRRDVETVAVRTQEGLQQLANAEPFQRIP